MEVDVTVGNAKVSRGSRTAADWRFGPVRCTTIGRKSAQSSQIKTSKRNYCSGEIYGLLLFKFVFTSTSGLSFLDPVFSRSSLEWPSNIVARATAQLPRHASTRRHESASHLLQTARRQREVWGASVSDHQLTLGLRIFLDRAEQRLLILSRWLYCERHTMALQIPFMSLRAHTSHGLFLATLSWRNQRLRLVMSHDLFITDLTARQAFS